MEEPLLVFVSSVITDMIAERQACQAAIRAIPLSRPWIFEHSPASSLPLIESYLRKVRQCDIFVLLLSDRITEPVRSEVQTATASGKPLLAFVSAMAPRDVVNYAQSLGVKYASYQNVKDLAAKVAEGVSDELIAGYRRHRVSPADLGALGDFLGRLTEGVVQISSGGVQVGRDQTVQGDLIVGSKIGQQIDTGGGLYLEGSATASPEINTPENLLRAYYRYMAAECSRLPLGVIDKEFVRVSSGSTRQGEQAILLPEIYVDLDVVAPPRERNKDKSSLPFQLTREEEQERMPLLEALSRPEFARTVLLGDAGSGKTTLVDHLGYLLSNDADRLPEPFRKLLPVRWVLRAVSARHIPAAATQGTAEMLWNALADDIAAQLGGAAADKLFPHLQHRLMTEGGFILLDGLDEVPEARQRRQLLLQAVTALARALPEGRTRVLVTARPHAYSDPGWRLPGFSTLALAPFSEAQVRRFIDRWYQAVRLAMGWNANTARNKGEQLRTALQQQPSLSDLASRPLLLTLIATLHSSWGQLPEDRAELYEETVKLLLGRWQRAREVRRPDGELEIEPGIAQALGIGEERIRATLEALAFAAHQQQRSNPERDTAPADIVEEDLLVAFKPLLSSLAPDTLLAYLRDRAGLIVERKEGVYAFPHRSFQEYLAACHLANGPDFSERLAHLIWEDPLWWREVCLLGVGKARLGGVGYAVAVVSALLPKDPDDVTNKGDAHWRVAALAGQALIELRLPEKTTSQSFFETLLKRSQRWMAQVMEGGHLSARERADVGDVLGQLGDPRPGVATITMGEASLPDIVWVRVPAGSFNMGSHQKDEMALDDECPRHTLTLPDFCISRYPITNAQYAPFLEDGGYEDKAYWTPEGWAWRQGAEADLSAIERGDLHEQYADWLRTRSREKRAQPYWWGDHKWSRPSRPVVGVNWYEASAYCSWLTSRLNHTTLPFKIWPTKTVDVARQQSKHIVVRLPSETEWEKAARGPQGWRWPWGNEWQADRANTEEAHLRETCAVGCFPGGDSRFGAADMAGNVWEWTRSRWGKRSTSKPDYGYPYNKDDGREDLDGSDLRVVRGGSWSGSQKFARCAFRGWDVPAIFYSIIGFRAVVSLSDGSFWMPLR